MRPPAAVALLTTVVAALLLFVPRLHPGIPAGDSGELIAVAHTLGTAHPPGYPLWTLLAAAWGALVPLGGYAFRLNLFSAVTAALAAGVVAAAVAAAPRGPLAAHWRIAAGVAAGLALACARPFFTYALVAEVFALNALFAACALLAFVALLRRRDAGASTTAPLVLLATIGGLFVGHHHTLVLLLLPLGMAAIAVARPARRVWGLLGLAFALGLLPLASLPMSAGRTPPAPLSWGDPVTVERFVRVLTRGDYGTFQLQSRESGLVADRSHVAVFAESLPRSHAPWGLALALAGFVVLLRDPRRRTLGLALLGFIALQLAFFTRVGFPTTPALYLGVVERFWILPAVVVAFGLGVGAAALFARLATVKHGRVLLAVVAPLTILGSSVWPALAFLGEVDQHENRFVAALADGVLASAPESSVVFVQGDLFHNALAVRTLVEGARPDVVVLDQEMMTYPWYVDRARRLHPGVLPARLGAEDRYDGSPASGNGVWLDHLSPTRPVVFLGLKERSFEPRYDLVPVGYVLRAYRKGGAPDLRALAESTLAVVARCDFAPAFAAYDPWSFEVFERGRMTELLARAARGLCTPAASTLSPQTTPGFTNLLAALERSRAAAGIVPEDPELVRARGYLYALHPAARDSARAEADLAATLAEAPAGQRTDEARRVVAWLRRPQSGVAERAPKAP